MGNCSSAAIHDKAIAEVEGEAGTELITVVRSTDGELLRYSAPIFVKDIVAGFSRQAPPLKRPKSPKKVRFAEEPVLISSYSNEGDTSSWTSSFNGEQTIRQRFSAETRDSEDQLLPDDDCVKRCPPTCPLVADDQLLSTRALRQRETLNEIVRLKVVISRKDLTELMSPKTPQSRAEAMAERIIGPLLLPQQTAAA